MDTNVVFAEIYERQEVFENLLISKSDQFPNKPLAEFDKKEKSRFSKELALLLHQEVAEFIGAVGNYKSHKTQDDSKGVKAVRDEIADMFIFVLNTALTHNMTAEELLEEVKRKQDVNFKRQETGY